MKIVHLSYSDMGGAGVAAKRLHLALLEQGVDSHLITLVKLGDPIPNHSVWQPAKKSRTRRVMTRLYSFAKRAFPFLRDDIRTHYLRGQKKGYEYFSFPYSANEIGLDERIQKADIVHLHWVADGMIDFNNFFKQVRKPIVWTLHDMNPFTGGCHHSDGCLEFTKSCVNCEQVQGTPDEYIAMRNLSYKLKSFEESKPSLTIITPSQWLGNLSAQSKLFKGFPHHVIPNITNEKKFTRGDKTEIRKLLNVPSDAFVLLFVAHNVDNPRKGINILLEAFKNCHVPNLVLATAGKEIDPSTIKMPVRQFGFITTEEKMRDLYTMADLFVLPSLAENFPNSIVESLLCGTPVIAHRVGGIAEQVNEKNGILVSPGDVRGMAAAIEKVAKGNYDPSLIMQEAQTRFGTKKLVQEHIELYRRVKQQQNEA